MNDCTGKKIAENVEKLCEAKEITIAQLQRDLGLSNGYIRKLRIGQTPSVDRLNKIADYLGVTSEFLTGAVSSLKRENASTGVKIPLLGRVAAGAPIEAVENLIGYEEVSSRMANTGELFALVIKGDSMAPFICDGDKVIVRQQPEVLEGEIAIFLMDDCDATCKVYYTTGYGMMLAPKNPCYDPLYLTREQIEARNVRIIGKVIEIRREL